MSKNRRILLLPALLLASALVFSGCGGSKKPVAAISSDAPKSTVAGYYSPEQSLSGGTDLKFINLRDIEVSKEASDYVITLTFKDGSLQMGMQEEDTKGVPKYSTQWIDGLDRLVLNINGLAYWDYKVWEDELKDTPILGIFKLMPVNNAEAMLTKLYINLKDDIAYRIEEKGNKLMLYIRAMPQEERSDYYVLLNAFEEYTDGKIFDDEGLSPTLCKDKTNVTLISKPFATEEEANKFLDNVNITLLPNLPGTVATVEHLKNDELPDYDENGALNAFAKAPVTRAGGVEKSAETLIANGKILCWKPDGRAYVYVTPFFLGGDSGEEATSYEKLYMNEVDSTTPTLLSDFEYLDIMKAEFSDDGKYLAFLEQGDTNRSLYIYNTTNNTILTAAEAGFGVDTANFVWGSGDDYKDVIYAITGENEMLQLMAYKLPESGNNSTPVVETLAENAFTEGDMGFFNGKIYFSQYGENPSDTGVYTFDVATKLTARVCDGYYFEMNRRTGNMAVLSLVSEDDQTYDLSIYNPRTGHSDSVCKGKSIAVYVWSGDGLTLFYTVYKDDLSDDDRYTLTLNQYATLSGDNTELTDIVEGDLFPSDKNTEVLLTCLYPQKNQYVAITYRIATAE
jgi:hypothetical protein